MLREQSGSFCFLEDIVFFLGLSYGVRDLDAPQTCKTDQLGRAWKNEAVPIPPSSSSVSQGWSLGSGGQLNQERTVTMGTSALQKQKVH